MAQHLPADTLCLSSARTEIAISAFVIDGLQATIAATTIAPLLPAKARKCSVAT
ncbi:MULTISPECIES: hypothetical protein [unclassified Shinella]|uniref:hypothetical protein n=1 Tax=unclassified Shinella TaxID=2643062 RepID=UPI00041109A4|nr:MULTISPECIES: hypothetical protein [unclassified Shinella]MCA0340874.1 hypothetical protein [Pseudomonadota bacterium]MCO5148812.1 hypothetical protein [Shinella sp.]MDG4676046.1 hypothetical protein [Shinella sp. 838]